MITTRGAYEQRSDDPAQDYGISGVEMTFELIGEDKAISWQLLTNDFLPHTATRLKTTVHRWMAPTAGAVDFHYKTEQYEGMMSAEHCRLLGGKCFYDTGYLIGDAVYEAWAYGGFDGVFGKLRELLEEA